MNRMKKLTVDELLSRFIDKWRDTSPETYADLWYRDISEEDIIEDLIEFYGESGLYRRILTAVEEDAWREGRYI